MKDRAGHISDLGTVPPGEQDAGQLRPAHPQRGETVAQSARKGVGQEFSFDGVEIQQFYRVD